MGNWGSRCSPLITCLQKSLPTWIFVLSHIFGHLIISVLSQPIDAKAIIMNPVVHVVILPAQTPEHVGEPVDELKMLPSQGSDPPKYCGVGHFVVEGGHPSRHVEGQLGWAVVQVCLIHGKEVDVVEDQAGVVELLHGLSESNIEQHSPTALLFTFGSSNEQSFNDVIALK